jgi:TPP-dependent pyruvate/acetoin dehydrogenase alpha subunit
METRLIESGMLTSETIDSMRERARGVVEDAVAFASSSPYPSFEELTTDVYA